MFTHVNIVVESFGGMTILKSQITEIILQLVNEIRLSRKVGSEGRDGYEHL